jgi:TetR/AcrR family transcriptional regulator, transcriptional repressor for nem operon
MPRPRKFDDSAVLDAATELFWERGYEHTSTRDLAAQMGMTTASLYNAYGDKQRLYATVLERYGTNATAWAEATLSDGLSGADALQSFFRALGEEALADGGEKGCLIVNTSLATTPKDVTFQGVVNDVLHKITGLFRTCVARGHEDGSISRQQNPDDGANLLLGVMLGLRVLARTRPDADLVRSLLRATAVALSSRRDG